MGATLKSSMLAEKKPNWKARAVALEFYALAAIVLGSLVYGIICVVESIL